MGQFGGRVLFLAMVLVLGDSSARVQIPQITLQSLINQALVESMAQKQRDLLADDLVDQDPEVAPGFHEGDMAGGFFREDVEGGGDSPELFRIGINFEAFPQRMWPNRTVHYMISPLYLPEEYMVVKTAIRILNFYTCLEFKEWDGNATDYLVIWPVEKPAGCWSYVGRLGGPQIVSLQAPDDTSPQCFQGIGRPLHEIMHALGVFHEQSRPDRDKYLSVVKGNVINGFISNFAKLDPSNVTLPFEYDYNSIMHYGSNFFSKNRKRATLVPKIPGAQIGQRINLSKLDCLKLNALYGCLDLSPFERRKYTAFCTYLGL